MSLKYNKQTDIIVKCNPTKSINLKKISQRNLKRVKNQTNTNQKRAINRKKSEKHKSEKSDKPEKTEKTERSDKHKDKTKRSDKIKSDKSNKEPTLGFVFVYEANNTLFSKIQDVPKTDGRLVIIHPVYYAGYNNTMFSEEVTYSESKNKYVSKSKEGSWLDVISKYPDTIFNMETDEVVYYDGMYYHCNDDLLHFLLNGADLETVKLNR